MDYLLDTNILLMYVRGNQTTLDMERDLELLTGKHRLAISVVSLGEVKAITIKNKWGASRIERLNVLLDKFLIADINVLAIIDRYAEIRL